MLEISTKPRLIGAGNDQSEQLSKMDLMDDIRSLNIPEGWSVHWSSNSVLFRKKQKVLPTIRVLYSPLRIDHDYGKPLSVKSDVYKFTKREQLIRMLTVILEGQQ